MGWYKTGTISVSGTVVTGASTNWTDNKQGIGPGQALLIPAAGTVKMYEILRVDSATKLTLTSDAGTVAAGQAYAIMSFYTDSIPDFARRLSAQLSYYQSQMDGWQQIMTGTGSITITAPDGTNVTISSFKKLTDDVAAKLDKNQNLNDLPNKSTARTNLGLGSSATRNAYSTTGNMLSEGDFGIGVIAPGLVSTGSLLEKTGWGAARNNEAFPTPTGAFICFTMRYDENSAVFHAIDAGNSTPQHYFRVRAGTLGGWAKYWTTTNTTKASDGTLKAASPVARIVKSREENQRIDVAEDGFSWCGSGTANDEAEGITISRLDVGVYLLSGSSGLATSGWQLLPPMDPGGMGEQGIVEAEQSDDGKLIIRLYKSKYILTAEGEIERGKGELIDVPVNSWIDVRLDMPADSIWNINQSEAINAMKDGDAEKTDDTLQQ